MAFFERLIVIIIGLVGFVMIPVDHGLLSVNDDDDYFAYASSIAYGRFPHFDHEYHVGVTMPYAAGGPGILAAPFVFAFSGFDRLESAPIVDRRTKENRYWSWSLLGFHVASIVYLILAVLILFRFLCLWTSRPMSLAVIVAGLFAGGGIFIYAFRRPIMSHVYELFSISLSLYLFSLVYLGQRSRRILMGLGLAAGFVFLTRYNNAFLTLGILGATTLILHRRPGNFGFFQNCTWLLGPLACALIFFRIAPVFVNGVSSADQSYGNVASILTPTFDFEFYAQRLIDIIFGVDMGLVFTAPVLLLGIFLSARAWGLVPKSFFIFVSFVLINIYVTMAWKSFGSFYGYRYIVFTAFPLLALLAARGLDTLASRNVKVLLLSLTCVLGFISFNSVLAFERSSVFSFSLINTKYGTQTYSNPVYHILLIQHLINNPFQFLEVSWKQGLGMLLSKSEPTQNHFHRLILYLVPWAVLCTLEFLMRFRGFIKRLLR